jgi:hypothetical protein
MNEDYRRRHGDAEWVMNQLELYLARAICHNGSRFRREI